MDETEVFEMARPQTLATDSRNYNLRLEPRHVSKIERWATELRVDFSEAARHLLTEAREHPSPAEVNKYRNRVANAKVQAAARRARPPVLHSAGDGRVFERLRRIATFSSGALATRRLREAGFVQVGTAGVCKEWSLEGRPTARFPKGAKS